MLVMFWLLSEFAEDFLRCGCNCVMGVVLVCCLRLVVGFVIVVLCCYISFIVAVG